MKKNNLNTIKLTSNRSFYTFILFLVFVPLMKSQVISDLNTFSSYSPFITARSAAMGGAFGALGADFSSASINPAGLGVYRTNDIMLSTSMKMNEVRGILESNASYSNSISQSLDNFGLVISTPGLSEKGLISINFSFGFNRIYDFNRTSLLSLSNSATSYTDWMASIANSSGINPEDISYSRYSIPDMVILGWDSYLINYNENSNLYESVLLPATDYNDPSTVNQSRYITEKGHLNEWNFALSGNINHNLYFGGGINIQDLQYKRTIIHSETFNNTYASDLDGNYSYQSYDPSTGNPVLFSNGSFQTDDYLNTSGIGFNIKGGIIYKPTESLRLGFAFHTPTLMALTDKFSSSSSSNLKAILNTGTESSPEWKEQDAPDAEFSAESWDYQMASPLRTVYSIAYQLGQRGLISFDYDRANFSQGYFESIEYQGSYSDLNQEIKKYLKVQESYRIGAELKMNANVSLRGGYSYTNSAFNNDYEFMGDKVNSTTSYSAGIGYRTGSFYFDAAYIMENQKYDHLVYSYSDIQMVGNFTSSKDRFLVTLGFRF